MKLINRQQPKGLKCSCCSHQAHSVLTPSFLHINKRKTIRSFDPTQTRLLRDRYVAQMRKRFKLIRKAIFEFVVKEDCFGLIDSPKILRRDFAFRTSSDKVTGFMDWLMKQEDDKILEITYTPGKSTVSRKPWEKMYIQSAYKKGMERSEKQLRKMGVKTTPFPNVPIFSVDVMFNLPIHADRIGLLYTRSFNELKGITDVMDQKISRSLAQGMAEGRGPREIARDLIKEVNISQQRAETLARTEIINAHAEATLNTYAAAGVHKVAVEAEWSTAQDDKVCPLCEPLDGKIFDLKEARGMIPRHPNCRCAWLPVVNFDK